MKTSKELQQAVEVFQRGNKESFNVIYEQSYKYLHTCVMHVVKNEEIAMDMLQETYLEISRNIEQLKNTETFLSWAAMIANRKCFAYLKKQKDVLVIVDEEEETENYFENIADDEAFIPETVIQDREKQRLIKEIIDDLSDIQRLCVIGFYYNEQKQDEIAEELGIPVNTVKSHLNRAKAKIKEAVIELDTKKGTRLYSIAPFMLLFLDLEAEACEVATMSSALSNLGVETVSNSVLAAEQTAKITLGVDKVAKAAAISVKTKAAIGAVAVALIAAGVGGTIASGQRFTEPVDNMVIEDVEDTTVLEDNFVEDEMVLEEEEIVLGEGEVEETVQKSEPHEEAENISEVQVDYSNTIEENNNSIDESIVEATNESFLVKPSPIEGATLVSYYETWGMAAKTYRVEEYSNGIWVSRVLEGTDICDSKYWILRTDYSDMLLDEDGNGIDDRDPYNSCGYTDLNHNAMADGAPTKDGFVPEEEHTPFWSCDHGIVNGTYICQQAECAEFREWMSTIRINVDSTGN